MKATKFRFRRLTTCGHSAALMLTMLLLIVAATPTTAQTNVFVPGTASGNFGSGGGAEKLSPLVSALTVSGPGTVTVTYVSGQVWWGGGWTGPNGAKWSQGANQQLPLQEGRGISAKSVDNIGALIGVFVPQLRVGQKGFNAIDGTKDITKVGIMPGHLFFVGTSKTFSVSEAGTLFLGINDNGISDNGGGFNVTVTGP
jgi:hypothetical protein